MDFWFSMLELYVSCIFGHIRRIKYHDLPNIFCQSVNFHLILLMFLWSLMPSPLVCFCSCCPFAFGVKSKNSLQDWCERLPWCFSSREFNHSFCYFNPFSGILACKEERQRLVTHLEISISGINLFSHRYSWPHKLLFNHMMCICC